MKLTNVSLFVAAAFAFIAVVAGMDSSYELTVVAVVGVGFLLSLRLVVLGAPVRPWAATGRPRANEQGPVALQITAIEGARRGSLFSQSQIATTLRYVAAQRRGEALPKDVLEPPREGERLKGDKYLSELEAVIKVLKND